MKKRICDVCLLLDGDTSEKECEYCRLCGAWICKACLPDFVRRVRAMAKTVYRAEEK
jgi:hypothetical protein